ncbi:unnamed protein product [Dracunculus medinensis]|uniref:RING-CH-type domain-containing protein n=1 Tax=Dracunculus medinensis TaxID=318479 RepID=A0A0N4UJH1_DRAME|nr:unnamed protein product [Dracunculus medinensis]
MTSQFKFPSETDLTLSVEMGEIEEASRRWAEEKSKRVAVLSGDSLSCRICNETIYMDEIETVKNRKWCWPFEYCSESIHYGCAIPRVRKMVRCSACGYENFLHKDSLRVRALNYIRGHSLFLAIPAVLLFFIIILLVCNHQLVNPQITQAIKLAIIALIILLLISVVILIINLLCYTGKIKKPGFLKRSGLANISNINEPNIVNQRTDEIEIVPITSNRIYQQPFDQTTITTGSNLETDRCLAASTPMSIPKASCSTK